MCSVCAAGRESGRDGALPESRCWAGKQAEGDPIRKCTQVLGPAGVTGQELGAGAVYASTAFTLSVCAPRTRPSFADSIASFKILPSELINLMAMGLPPLEIFLGVMLVTGWRMRVASFGVLLLSIIFAFAILAIDVTGFQH